MIRHIKPYAILLIFILSVFGVRSCALDFDVSVDEEIRKNYNPSKLEMENLPPVPGVSPSSQSKPAYYNNTKPANNLPALSTPTQKPIISAVNKSTALKLPCGTKFRVKSLQGLSDSSREGARISFVSLTPVSKLFVTIPQGTVFNGQIVDSHLPQISGNGGLLVLSIDSMNYKGKNIYINAKVTKVNHKNVYINNIKGKRSYLKNISKQVNKGDRFYKKTRRASAKLSNNPVGTIISPIPTIVGMGAYAVNFVGSPIFALFGKGGKISIPAGSEFEIKLVEDAYLPH